jgi:hypothetical protein
MYINFFSFFFFFADVVVVILFMNEKEKTLHVFERDFFGYRQKFCGTFLDFYHFIRLKKRDFL